jgi:hypothetical protein
MEVYRRETEEIIRRFLEGMITQEQCVTLLYAAFTGVLPRVGPEDLEIIRAIMTDNEKVMRRMRRRNGRQKLS